MTKKIFPVLLFITFLICAASCGYSPPAASGERLNIVATNFPAYDFCRALAGEHADITMLLSPGEESHSFDPTPMDILKLHNADLFVYGGGESDEWAEKILTSADKKIPAVKMMDYVGKYEEEIVEGMEVRGGENGGEDEEYDEHIWTSPVNTVLICEGITEALCRLDEKNAGAYRSSSQLYIEKLKVLDMAFKRIVQSGKRNELIFADRFPLLYFVKEYGLEYSAAFPGCSGETEASPATLGYLINKIQNTQTPYILKIEMSSDSMAKSIAGQTGAEILTFYSCQSISQNDFENGETYLSLMEKNLDTLYKALN
ncbi:MAG: metal ABC transporter substrate-binding protein [Clostridia bacterium]|nr:metal ABC transporter substrate-binding protein [Clostridia bacterium]